MIEPIRPVPDKLVGVKTKLGRIQSLGALGLPASTKLLAPLGDEVNARAVLHSFLNERSQHYRANMSSLVTAFDSSSCLSAYLAWGNLSVRQIYQATQARRTELKVDNHVENRAEDSGDKSGDKNKDWLVLLASFSSHLQWHNHFIQKLEDQPTLEFVNTNRRLDGLRENNFNQAYFEAWRTGQTGYPMVDACMRALTQTSWLNFRMRAMIVSFASYFLWLHWHETGQYLDKHWGKHWGKHWIDFESGIYWPQMQSGVTGINSVRIYPPRKQVEDQDPKGVFIRQWVPELQDVPASYLSAPYTMPEMVQQMAGCTTGKDYLAPIVDPKTSYTKAKQRMRDAKLSPAVQTLKYEVLERHGSRATPSRRRSGW